MTFARDPINPNLVCDPDTGATVKCIGSNEIEEYWFEVAIGDWKFGFGGTVSDRPGGHENGRVGVWLSLEGFNLELVRRGRLNKPENNVLLAYLMPAIKLLIPNKLNGDYELWTSPSLEAFCRKNNVPQVIDILRVDASGSLHERKEHPTAQSSEALESEPTRQRAREMPTKFTEEQVQEAIAALKCEFPDIWDVLHSCMRDPFADNDEKFARISRAMGSTLKKLPFVAQAADPYQAKQQLRRQVTDVARSEFRRLSANDDQGRVCTPPIKEAP